MSILNKITWQEFSRIIEIIETKDIIRDQNKQKIILKKLKSTKKQRVDIEVPDLSKDEFLIISVLVDNWNIIKDIKEMAETETDNLGTKLKQAYHKNFNEKLYTR